VQKILRTGTNGLGGLFRLEQWGMSGWTRKYGGKQSILIGQLPRTDQLFPSLSIMLSFGARR
jgi:hypothetical protein